MGRISLIKRVKKSNLMNLTFFTKILISSAQKSLGLVETFSYEREAVWCIEKVYCTAVGENNHTCISCVFNGFKYSYTLLKYLVMHASIFETSMNTSRINMPIQNPITLHCRISLLVVAVHVLYLYETLHEKPTIWFPTWSDTNQAVHLQKMARGLKLRK